MNSTDKKFMELAVKLGQKTNCPRPDRKVGAVIVKNGKIIGEGYNYIPERINNSCNTCCYRKKHKIASGTCMEKCFSICAEQHAIRHALESGADLKGATIYTSLSPCSICARWIIFVGIKKVVYMNEYHDEFAKSMLDSAKVELKSIQL